MKLTGRLEGAPMRPDYAMLRAALVAAQAATPTGIAAGQDPTGDPLAAMHDLLTAAEAVEADARVLSHSFARNVPGPGDEA